MTRLCPRFITPTEPNYNEPLVNYNQDASVKAVLIRNKTATALVRSTEFLEVVYIHLNGENPVR
jgi:hypothetical protein